MTDTSRTPDPQVFLTGFPGFLGSRLIERLLARGDGPIVCLVQPQYRAVAERRAAEIAGDNWRARIRLVDGDITESDLGLESNPDQFASVAEVFHLAAVYDLSVSRELGEAVNVRGTEHVLDFTEQIDAERLHYVSTCYVSGRYDGVFTESHLREGQRFNNHYEATKYRAEVAVRERMTDGLPATIYRPAITVGDSETGETDKYDGPYYLLRLLAAQPRFLSLAPRVPGAARTELNVVPRDYVVDAVAHLSGRADTVGETYQLCDPAPLTVPRFVSALGDALDHRVVSVSLPKRVVKGGMAALDRRGISAEPATLDYFDHPTRYANPQTQRALAGTGIDCPRIESYLDRLVDYVRDHPAVGDDAMV